MVLGTDQNMWIMFTMSTLSKTRSTRNKYVEWVDDNLYHVYIQPTSCRVRVTCIGVACDEVPTGWYGSVDELPQWMQSKLAALLINPHIEGAGIRRDKHTFTVVGGEWK